MNAITSDTEFLNLLRSLGLDARPTAEQSGDSRASLGPFPLFTWFYSCPLWSLFLNPSDEEDGAVWRHQLEWMTLQLASGPGGVDSEAFRRALRTPYQYATDEYRYPNLHPLLNTLEIVGMGMTVQRIFYETIGDSIHFSDSIPLWEKAIIANANALMAAWAYKQIDRGPRQKNTSLAMHAIRDVWRELKSAFPALNEDDVKASSPVFKGVIFPLFQKHIIDG